MHYRTPKIGFLETADEFLALMANVRLDTSSFHTDELDGVPAPLVMVPATP